MKYERTASFKRDYGRLSESQQDEFKKVVPEFSRALDARADSPGGSWPTKLRVKGVVRAPGIWEMTWSFKDPDGRATWEWIEIDGETAIRWRRIGSHTIFKKP